MERTTRVMGGTSRECCLILVEARCSSHKTPCFCIRLWPDSCHHVRRLLRDFSAVLTRITGFRDATVANRFCQKVKNDYYGHFCVVTDSYGTVCATFSCSLLLLQLG